MSSGAILGALLQLILLGIVGCALGNLVLDRFVDRDAPRLVGGPERALAAIAGAVLFSVGAMVAHIISGGAVFGSPWPVPVAALGVVWIARRHVPVPRHVPWLRLVIATLMLAAIYVTPALAGGSSIRTGDPPWHLGWTNQLLAGEPVPTGPAPQFSRNAYPWGLHAVMATAVRTVPGSDPLVALEMLHLVVLAGIPLASCCLARRACPEAGWAAAAAASLIGGFGWVTAAGPDFITSPGNAIYGADLVAASPNSVYELFPPALPRELGLVMLGAAGWLILTSASSSRHNVWAVAGAAVGLVGLVSVPLFVTAALWLLVGTAFVARGLRVRWLITSGAAAAAIFGLWAGPVASHAARFGGFVNITPQLGREWPLPVALASWGLLLPLALIGTPLARRNDGLRPLVAFAAASAALLGVAIARGHLGWDLAGNATLLHQGRMWPPAHLLAAALAGVALMWLYARSSRWNAWLGPLLLTVVLLVGAASPALASRGLSEIMARGSAGFQYGGDDFEPTSFPRRAAEYLGPGDIVEVRHSDELAFLLFQLSGVKLATYDDPRLPENDLRIRYADLASAYEREMDADGFRANYLVVPAPEAAYERALVRGSFDGRDWILVQLNA